MKLKDYLNCVDEIATGYFTEDGEYVPHMGKANLVRVYAKYYYANDKSIAELNRKYEAEQIESCDYIDKLIDLVGSNLLKEINGIDTVSTENRDIKENKYFSFGCAVKDAEAIVDFQKNKKIHTTELDQFLHNLNEQMASVTPEQIEKLSALLAKREKLDEAAMVDEYFKSKEFVDHFNDTVKNMKMNNENGEEA